MKRPLLRVALLFALGILAGAYLPVSPALLFVVALSLCLLALALPKVRPALLSALVVLTGWTDYSLHTAIVLPQDLRRVLGTEPHLAVVRGALQATPVLRVSDPGDSRTWRTVARLRLTELRLERGEWQSVHGLMVVTMPGLLTNLVGGQRVEVSGVALLPRIAAAEGTFDYRAYLRTQGIYYQLQTESADDWKVLDAPRAPPLGDRFRDWGRAALARGLPGEDESLRLEWALTLGWKPALTEEVSEPFIRAATYHIFAVDGLRMAIVFGIGFGLLRACGVPRAWAGVALLPVIWFYVALTGWPASAIRATVMLSVVIGGWVLRRPGDLLNSLFCAAVLILTWEPQQLFQAGFQLSFFVVLCLVVTLPPLFKIWNRWLEGDALRPRQLRRHWPEFVSRPARYAGDVLLTSFAAWVGSIPLVAYYFHILTPISTPANLAAVPLCALVLISNLASLLAAAWFPALSVLFNHAGWFLMECIRVSSLWFATWPVAWFYVSTPTLFTIGLYYALLLGLTTPWLLAASFRRWKISAAALACIVWGVLAFHSRDCARLTVLPVGGGHSIYAESPGWRTQLLIDTGNTNAVQFVTKPFLQAQGLNVLPALVLTHGDLHHVGGAEGLAREFRAQSVCASPLRFRSVPYRRTLEHLRTGKLRFRMLSRNDSVDGWRVLHPQAEDRFSKADDGALVLQKNIGVVRILLVSDLGRTGQQALLQRTPGLRTDILVSGLPATGEPVCDELLDALQPRVIIVADSEMPASERASAALQERLGRRRIPVIYTRVSGAATIEVRDGNWQIRTMRGEVLSGPAGGV